MYRIALLLSLVSIVATPAGARQALRERPAAPPQNVAGLPIMNRQRAVHGPSRMGGMTSTRDGRWLFQSEGTTLVFLETSKKWGALDERRMQRLDGSKRVPFGAEAFTVSRMMLDPAADDVPGPNVPGDVRNLFFIAAGRSGLWAMEADVDPAVTNRVWRIDDSMDSDPAVQDGERWCCDVDVATIAGVDYVVALFGSKSDSRLRLYRMSDVRAIADPANANSERGSELAPFQDVVLGDHPQAPPAPPAPTYARSVALSMDVDISPDMQGAGRADVYVAMGSHGLVLVSFSGPGATPALRWGPIFGTGSAYAAGNGHPAGMSDELYGNLVLEDAAKYTDPDPIMRRDFPVFADVAVFRGTTVDQEEVHHLYVAVDHLFWLVFDLDEIMAVDMPILHHAGVEISYTSQHGTLAQRVVAPSAGDNLAGCARELGIANHPVHGPYLFVTTAGINFVKDFSAPTEGYVFDARLEWAGGRGSIRSKQQTQWYSIRSSYTASQSAVDVTELGGSSLHVPEVQEGGNTIKFFHRGRIGAWSEGPRSRNGVGMSEVRALTGGPAPHTIERSLSHSAGRQSFALSVSLLDPDLIFTGGNDGGVPKDGFLALGTNDIKRHYQPTGIPRVDERGVGGFFIDTGSQWQEPGQAFDRQYLFCSGTNRAYADGTPPFWTQIRWQLLELQVPGTDAYLNAPVRERWWYVTPPRDNFGNLGFLWYMNAYVNPEFDEFLDAAGRSERLAFATHVRTAEGLTVIDRDELMAHALTQGNGRELHLDSGNIVATSRSLVTHPEFNDMPRGDATTRAFWQHTLPGNQDDNSVALQWMPTLVEVQAKDTTDFGSWVLAVPCGHIYANPDWDIYTHPTYGSTEWLPDAGTIWEQKYSHGLVQFWEVAPNASMGGDYWPITSDDPGLDDIPGTADDVAGNSPLRKIISPDPEANIWKVVPLRMDVEGTERVFLVCVDFAGHVYVYSIEDILDTLPANPDDPAQAELDASFRVAEWSAPSAHFDDLPNNVFDVGVDHRGGDRALFYVAVRRIGVVLLEFDPSSTTPLIEIDRIQTPDFASKVEIRQDNNTLIVNDYGGGIRVYED